ncbi:MAG TPA: zinc carboxypeptidase, partial [Chitinophagaceae bacterium]|nr:zinc carboxypeptidase [Chitinophagaceae bacterium]
SLHRYEDREREGLKSFVPGTIFRVELDNTHPLAFGYPDYYYTMKQDSRMYEFLKSGWNVGVIKKENQVAGFVGSSLKSKLKDGMIFGAQPLGGGQIIYLADNILFRNFWENGKLLFCNALFMTGN